MMEYWNILKRNLLLVILVSALASFIAFVVVSRQAVVYEVHYSYLVALEQREDVEDYRFDGFYALESTDSFSRTLAQWITTPEVVAAAYEEGDLVPDTEDPRELTKIISADKTAPQLVEVSIKHKDENKAIALAKSLQTVVGNKIDRYHDQGIPAISFNAVPGEMWTGHTELSVKVIVIGIFIFTFLLGINILLVIASLKRIKD